jgi:type II secretory pathway pseudopilin PulG
MSLVSRPKKRAYSVMRLQILQRGWFTILFLAGILSIVTAMILIEASSASAAAAAMKAVTSAETTAQRYAEAMGAGNKVGIGQLDFACQYPLVAASPHGIKTYPDDSDSLYDSCWQRLRETHASTLIRTDVGMEILWPSNGELVFFSEDLNRYPASAFVTDSLGLTPPGTGFHIHIVGSAPLPSASFRLRPNGPIVAVPTTLVKLSVSYQDPLTAPLTYAAGSVKWTNTIKRTRRALKEITTQWVVLSGLKKHGFAGDMAVVNLPVTSGAVSGSGVQEQIPFVTETSRALPDSLVWWGPTEVPGLLTAGAARAATFPELRDRVAMLNRVLIIDPNQAEALMVLSRHLYATVLREAIPFHKLTVRDPALALVVNEHFWNIYAQAERMDLSLGMEMGGFDKPTTADYLYRMLSAMQTLAIVRPEQLDNRFRLGVAYRWNNDQEPAIATHQSLVKAIPAERRAGRAEALLQLAWSRVNKVAWNRNFDDPDIRVAYQDADEAFTLADLPLDKFMAEYTKAYSLLFTPDRDNRALLERLTEAKRWFAEIPGQTPDIWQFFIGAESLKAVLDADPIFQTILAQAEEKRG